MLLESDKASFYLENYQDYVNYADIHSLRYAKYAGTSQN